MRHASAGGDSARLSLGRGVLGVGWVSARGADRGTAEVWADGVEAGGGPLDLYSPEAQTRRVVFASNQLDASRGHALEVRVLGSKGAASGGTRVDVDAFVVLRKVG